MAELNFTITGIIERRRVDVTGHLVRYFEIHYETTHGAIGTVEVPAKDFKVEKALEAVAPIADELEATFG